jgi:outer membrane lipoprotein-sorting protein
MKSLKIILSGLLFSTLLVSDIFALTGREIMMKNDALPEGKTGIQESVLVILKGSRKEIKKFNGISKKYGKKTRTRITFTSPTRLGFLVWDAPGKESVQWIKLTSGKVRKISSSDKGNAWMNSHFYNEDIGSRDINDYKYKLIGKSSVNGAACYKVEARKKKRSKVYSKIIIYVAVSDWVARKIDFFERGRHSKTIVFSKIKKISGIYTARKAVMKRTDGKGKSILYIKSIKYNLPVSNSKLKREGL